ncbi:hypothetical protein caldi_24880 [Caldinitratiruptor microaerophilus]|uniref:Uncharacterized protein n=1 Tax=Caldinitratiruptor microaerophilus TaxID=671077 RepID=A0AA35G9F3_9FIRM|nr:hypothetical protein caldi_24880 [Caldinitratiruptor microaerophilus]
MVSWWKAAPVATPRRAGHVEGILGSYRWEAFLARAPVSYGLDTATLYKGSGRIVRLALYARLPGTRLWRKVAAYHRGWLFGRRRYLDVLRRVVDEIEAVG